MKLVTIDDDGGQAAGAILEDGSVLEFAQAVIVLNRAGPTYEGVPRSVREILEHGALEPARRMIDAAEEADGETRDALIETGAIRSIAEARLAAPLPRPSLILSVGLAYREHLEEMNVPEPPEPTAFLKAQSSVIGSGRPIILPADHADMVDYEGEFSIVMGKPCHNVEAAEAMDYVAGYTIANDVSARDWVATALNAEQTQMEAAQSWMNNIHGKQFPTFTPLGPALVTADEVPEPGNLRLTTKLNGEIVQDVNTGDMIFPLARVISHFSQWYRFRPGDIITTGSPSGVGYGRDPKVFLRNGDLVEVSVSGLGTLTNPVIDAD